MGDDDRFSSSGAGGGPDDDILDAIVDALAAATTDDDTAMWVRVDSSPRGRRVVRVGSEVDGLLGWRAPPACVAVGTVAAGWATPVAVAPADGAPAVDRRMPCRVACLLDRSGRLRGQTRYADHVCAEPPGGGRLIDCLHRVLDLATPAPTAPAGPVVARRWLAAIVRRAEAQGRRLDWTEATALYPGGMGTPDGPEQQRGHDVGLVEGGRRRPWTWESIRLACANGCWEEPSIDPALAAWMDAGMFSRWVARAGTYPMSAGVEALGCLTPEAATRTIHLLGVLGVRMPMSPPAPGD